MIFMQQNGLVNAPGCQVSSFKQSARRVGTRFSLAPRAGFPRAGRSAYSIALLRGSARDEKTVWEVGLALNDPTRPHQR